MKVIRFGSKTPDILCTTPHISCPSYKTNKTQCSTLGFLGDPITNECIPRCITPCDSGTCTFCYCLLPTEKVPSKGLDHCFYLYNRERCGGRLCTRETNYCPDDYVISPYDRGECVRRCDSKSCDKGRCSSQGTCVCHLGYRPDPLNPKTCTKIPTNPLDSQPPNCRENRESTSANRCNETCKLSVIYQCPEGYEFNDSVTDCVIITVDDDLNLNDTRITPNMTIVHTKKTAAANTSSNLYIPISAFIFAILLATIFVLVFIIIKLKRAIPKQANPQEQNEEVDSEHYYSVPKF
ncbi:hypothetical protein Trydic_g19891 [Trypoxylus dichotomus]